MRSLFAAVSGVLVWVRRDDERRWRVRPMYRTRRGRKTKAGAAIQLGRRSLCVAYWPKGL